MKLLQCRYQGRCHCRCQCRADAGMSVSRFLDSNFLTLVERAYHRNYPEVFSGPGTVQRTEFSFKDFFSECDQIRRKLRIWSH